MAQTQQDQQQDQQQARQCLPFYENQEFIQGKLEIQEDYRINRSIFQDLCPETKNMLNDLLCEWTRDNYSEIVQLLHQDTFTEYEDSRDLSEIFYDTLISGGRSSSLIEFTINSGIIENHRGSIYLYCSESRTLNIDHARQSDEPEIFDITNDPQMARRLLGCYYNTCEIMVNEFIEIRDNSLGLK